MADRPIIFSAAMVRALLVGRKTQTRRLATSPLAKAQSGDRLWVREALTRRPLANFLTGGSTNAIVAAYAADDADVTQEAGFNVCPWWSGGGGLPSIHMPRWASRLTLAINEVRVEPLRSITEADAIAEGVDTAEADPWDDAAFVASLRGHTRAYAKLWDELHRKPGERWADNPAVVALSFALDFANIDAGGAR